MPDEESSQQSLLRPHCQIDSRLVISPETFTLAALEQQFAFPGDLEVIFH
jgi:hypothetical protein